MIFKKFNPSPRSDKHPRPLKMKVGQIVMRTPPGKFYRYAMHSEMRKGIAQGMEFSIVDDGITFAIRRDK